MKLEVIKQRSLWWTISAAIVLAGIVAMFINWQQIKTPLPLSLDFVGGTRLQLELDCTKPNNCDKAINPALVRTIIDEQGLAGSSIQVVGTEEHALNIRTSTLDVDQRDQTLSGTHRKSWHVYDQPNRLSGGNLRTTNFHVWSSGSAAFPGRYNGLP